MENFLKDFEELKAYGDIKLGFALKKNLEESKRTAADVKQKEQIESLLIKVKAFMIPWVSSEEISNLFKNELLNILKTEINIKERIDLRIFPYPEESQDFVRIELMRMIIKNQEQLGEIPISKWIEDYEKFSDFKKGQSLDRKNFIEKNAFAQKLSMQNKQTLLRIVDFFDFLKPNEDYKDEIQKIPRLEPENKKVIPSNKLNEKKIENLTIFEALKKYTEIGDQAITSNKIKLQSFPEPVYPSVKNWLTDYTLNVGRDNSDSMKRGIYLFQSTNGKSLSSEERNRLSMILKSYDEGAPVAIDNANGKIVFETQIRKTINEPTNQTSSRTFNTAPIQITPNHEIPKKEGLTFSSPQVLPFEKEKQERETTPTQTIPLQSKPRIGFSQKTEVSTSPKLSQNQISPVRQVFDKPLEQPRQFISQTPTRNQLRPEIKPQSQQYAPINSGNNEPKIKNHIQFQTDIKRVPPQQNVQANPNNAPQTQNQAPQKLEPLRIGSYNRNNVVNLKDF